MFKQKLTQSEKDLSEVTAFSLTQESISHCLSDFISNFNEQPDPRYQFSVLPQIGSFLSDAGASQKMLTFHGKAGIWEITHCDTKCLMIWDDLRGLFVIRAH